jgi:polyribonucleotide nucleotidyltransferase
LGLMLEMKKIELDFHGTKVSIECGRIAKLADGAALVQAGGTVVLVTVCSGGVRDGDFFPLSVDYVEKTYAVGKIPGGFFKREGKLSEYEILVSRLIDRPCRPLFPKGYRREVQVIATVLSSDGVNSTDTLSLLGASAALTISSLPFEGPVAGVRLGRVDGQIVINPSHEVLEKSDLSFLVAGSSDALVMVEGEAREVPEEEVLDALFQAHQALKPLIEMQLELQRAIGREKEIFVSDDDEVLNGKIQAFMSDKVDQVVSIVAKSDRSKAISELNKSVREAVKPEGVDTVVHEMLIGRYFDAVLSDAVRKLAFDKGVRIDGRDTKTVRPISIDVGLLPRVHGSALFTRGETQGLVAVTLGAEQEAQRLDGLTGESTKSFMLHYNFPPFSVGECKPLRGTGRREIGHGALAERAVAVVMPPKQEFPYVVRIVSEITESNGSSSMATVCGASLALMDAGIPIRRAVGGVAMGLLLGADGRFAILTDILGDEDHLGDMDFKVCGTEVGVTAVQMDIKVKGLTREIMSQALSEAREARLHILSEMNKVISKPRVQLSEFAPRIVTIKINPDKVRDIIGPGGKMIRSITDSCRVRVDVTDDGTVNIVGSDRKGVESAVQIIEGLTQEVVIGKLYEGVVKKIVEFGAFVEVIPGTDGLVHISQLQESRVKNVADVLQEGDLVWVKVLDVDRQGKIRLSMKEASAERGVSV